jgi:nucleoside-diphosphate-sugar epimerase
VSFIIKDLSWYDKMDITNKRIFMTGGRGFIASNIIKELLKDNEITIYDNGRRDALKYFSVDKEDNIKIIQGDVLDLNNLKKAMKDHDIVLHLAAVAGVSSYYRHPFRTMEVNFVGTYNALFAAKENNIELFVNFSTSEVYGANAVDVSESDCTGQGPVGEFRWTYSTSKLAAEHLCFAYSEEKGLQVVSIRPFNIYGPGQVGEGAIQAIVSDALEGKDVTVTGDGMQTRSWCYISDMVHAVKLILTNEGAIGNVFNIGNPDTRITMLALAKKIIKLLDSESKIVMKEHIGADVMHRNLSIDKAKKILKYEPKVELDEGILSAAKWYKENQ